MQFFLPKLPNEYCSLDDNNAMNIFQSITVARILRNGTRIQLFFRNNRMNTVHLIGHMMEYLVAFIWMHKCSGTQAANLINASR